MPPSAWLLQGQPAKSLKAETVADMDLKLPTLFALFGYEPEGVNQG
jgi:hypothetical protein